MFSGFVSILNFYITYVYLKILKVYAYSQKYTFKNWTEVIYNAWYLDVSLWSIIGFIYYKIVVDLQVV